MTIKTYHVGSTVNPLRCFGSNTQFTVVGQENRYFELHSVGVHWQKNQRWEGEQWKDSGESAFCCEINLQVKSINLGVCVTS